MYSSLSLLAEGQVQGIIFALEHAMKHQEVSDRNLLASGVQEILESIRWDKEKIDYWMEWFDLTITS